ncbi:uncharacterized protein LOC106090146 [Stomoxys calcitrans]|uniref:MADF domain-containing protein n=1 Tax=Stomoxys calcitrans TaxID=35570 RepID=A0A1I8Q1W1_STOCA|nr:uncharacterized protein LOC106090146 [Stomoxys calcitrans]
MDINIKIIEAVRKSPCLYCSSKLEERNKQWKKLADDLGIGEQTLKLRWHSILKRYNSDKFYKYADKLQFIQRTIKAKSTDKWPEFEINADDTAGHQRNSEEYMFLEVDEFDEAAIAHDKFAAVKHEKTDSVPTECTEDESSQGFATKSESANKHHEKTKENYNLNQEEIIVPVIKQTDKKSSQKSPKNNMSVEKEIKDHVVSPLERSEDVIFGELVTAMLKGMSEDKKRNIKKEIMNLLLT